MQNWLAIKKLLIALALMGLLLAPLAVYAQEETPTEETATAEEAAPPPGLGTLVLLIGLGAVAAVGGRLWLRDNYQSDGGSTSS
jgi:hypothetical protein